MLPPAPAAIEALYPASNRFATRPRTRLAPGDRFAFRAAIAFERAVERRELRWRLLDEAGQAVPAFTRSDVAAAPAGQRTAFVEGRVPEDLPAGRYRVELTIDVPGHAPLTRQAALEVAPPDLWVRRVRLAPISTGALEPGARASLRVEYEVRGAAAGPARRVTWRLTDDTGAPAEGVGGAQRTGGGEAGAFAFTRTLTLPPDLPRGRYVLWIEVLAGSVRGAHALPLEVE